MQIDLPIWAIVLIVTVLGLGVIGGVIYLARVAILLAKILEGMNALLPLIPVVISMANQFKRDSGSSLRDELDKNTEQGRRSEQGDIARDHKIDNLRAEQTRLALEQKVQPATAQTITVEGVRVGQVAAGSDNKQATAVGEVKKIVGVIEGTIIEETKKE